jgi:hypothetical protein
MENSNDRRRAMDALRAGGRIEDGIYQIPDETPEEEARHLATRRRQRQRLRMAQHQAWLLLQSANASAAAATVASSTTAIDTTTAIATTSGESKELMKSNDTIASSTSSPATVTPLPVPSKKKKRNRNRRWPGRRHRGGYSDSDNDDNDSTTDAATMARKIAEEKMKWINYLRHDDKPYVISVVIVHYHQGRCYLIIVPADVAYVFQVHIWDAATRTVIRTLHVDPALLEDIHDHRDGFAGGYYNRYNQVELETRAHILPDGRLAVCFPHTSQHVTLFMVWSQYDHDVTERYACWQLTDTEYITVSQTTQLHLCRSQKFCERTNK